MRVPFLEAREAAQAADPALFLGVMGGAVVAWFAVGGLPISPAGLGTRPAAMLQFFGTPFGGTESGAAILAFGFSFPVVRTLGRCLVGVFYPKEFAAARSSTEPT